MEEYLRAGLSVEGLFVEEFRADVEEPLLVELYVEDLFIEEYDFEALLGTEWCGG